MLQLEIRQQTFALLPERALWHPASRTLFVADLHLGKSSAFRSAGIPVPETTARTLARLSVCLRTTAADRLVILGDLLHAPAGRTANVLAQVLDWRAANTSLEVLLVRGNHDRSSGDPPPDWRFDVLGGPLTHVPSGMILAHSPDELSPDLPPALCGHLHPKVSVTTFDRSAIGGSDSAPCLWITPRFAVLPAFGDFVGGMNVRPAPHDRVFAATAGEVIELTRVLRSRPAPARR
ncbi:MAG: ligase-associated DNA damage response endonuclease PdeM [Phycisphaerales bacterium]